MILFWHLWLLKSVLKNLSFNRLKFTLSNSSVRNLSLVLLAQPFKSSWGTRGCCYGNPFENLYVKCFHNVILILEKQNVTDAHILQAKAGGTSARNEQRLSPHAAVWFYVLPHGVNVYPEWSDSEKTSIYYNLTKKKAQPQATPPNPATITKEQWPDRSSHLLAEALLVRRNNRVRTSG